MKTINKKTVKIRRMVSSDITSTLGIWWAEIPEKDMVADQLRGGINISFIAEYEGTLVGFILAKLAYSGFPLTAAGVAFLIEVHPEYQRSGIGNMLINALEKYCASEKIGTVRAIIPKNDKRMIKYFADKGFVESNLINYDKSCPVK
jgi:ribosomal protein S18 acetylase RimI-like enzyme